MSNDNNNFNINNNNIHTCTNTHTYINTYIHTYIYTYIHTYIYTYIHTYVHMCISMEQGQIHQLVTIGTLKPLICHKPELSSIISIKVVHNYLAFISIEKILSFIDLKGIVTGYIWTEKECIFMGYAVWWIIFIEIICSFEGCKWT